MISRIVATIAGLAAVGLIGTAVPAADTPFVPAQAHALLERTVSATGPGAVFLVTRGDQTLYEGARGRASIELDVPLTTHHVFRIASITKIFVAASILKLHEAGALSLDEPLAKRLPEIRDTSLTIRQVLQHTAGISDTAGPRPPAAPPAYDRTARIAEIGQRPTDFTPGSGWRYSNAGYIVLGGLIERVTGKPWHVAIDEQFAAPLGLRHTRYAEAAPLVAGRASGYTTDGRTRETRNVAFINPTGPDAAGALVSTARDLAAWMRALSQGRAISRDSLRQMVTPAPHAASPARYGLGVYVWQVRGETMIGHTGQIPGFASIAAYLPAHDVTIVALGNDDAFDARVVGRRLAAMAIGSPYPEVKPVTPTAETLTALAGRYRIDEATVRTLSVQDGRLYAQRGSGSVLPLQITAEGRLHFDPDALGYFVPVRDASGAVVRLDYYPDGEGPPQALPRIAP
jgi:D-alanyl-D-alanine carboxypeptidase